MHIRNKSGNGTSNNPEIIWSDTGGRGKGKKETQLFTLPQNRCP